MATVGLDHRRESAMQRSVEARSNGLGQGNPRGPLSGDLGPRHPFPLLESKETGAEAKANYL